MQTKNDFTFPFNDEQIEKFRQELKKAGTFDKLMFRKRALQRRFGMKYVRLYRNIERYKRKYLNGVYEPLRPMYDTEMPYVFWSALYEVILKQDGENI